MKFDSKLLDFIKIIITPKDGRLIPHWTDSLPAFSLASPVVLPGMPLGPL